MRLLRNYNKPGNGNKGINSEVIRGKNYHAQKLICITYLDKEVFFFFSFFLISRNRNRKPASRFFLMISYL